MVLYIFFLFLLLARPEFVEFIFIGRQTNDLQKVGEKYRFMRTAIGRWHGFYGSKLRILPRLKMFFYNPGVFSKVYLILHRHPCYSRQPAGFEAPIIPNIRDRKLWINIDKTYVSLILEFAVRRVHHRTDIELLEMIKVTAVKLVPGLTGKRKTYILETC